MAVHRAARCRLGELAAIACRLAALSATRRLRGSIRPPDRQPAGLRPATVTSLTTAAGLTATGLTAGPVIGRLVTHRVVIAGG